MQAVSLVTVQALVNRDFIMQVVQVWLGDVKKSNETWVEYFSSKERRRKLLLCAWVAAVVLALILTAVSLWISGSTFHNSRPGTVFVVFLWAVMFGGTALLTFPSKLIIAIFGALLGVSLSEISTGFDGLLEKAAKVVASISHHVISIAGPVANGNTDFITWMVWLFVVIVALLCLPAFFTE